MGVRSQPHVDDIQAAVGQPRRLEFMGHAGCRLIQTTDLVRSSQPVRLRLPDARGDEGRGQQVVTLRVAHRDEALVTEPQMDGAAHRFRLGGDEWREGVSQCDAPGTTCQRQVGDSPSRHRLGQNSHGVLTGPLSGVAQCRDHDDGWCRSRSCGRLDLSDHLGVGRTAVSHSRAPRAAWPGPPGRRDRG